MEFKKRINADIPTSVSQLQAMMKQFLLKHRLYKILLRGKGLEFETYRRYAQDDDSSAIDWKASKRSNSILVKQYRDERNLKIVFIVDTGENMVFGSSDKLKCEYAAEVVCAFSHLILTTGDKAGVALFAEKLKEYIKPSGGDKHFHLLVDRLTDTKSYGTASDLRKGMGFAIDYLNKNIDSVVIVSDFIHFNKPMIKPLVTIASKFETLVLAVRDPMDKSLPDIPGEIVMEDPRTGQQLLINPKVARGAYEKITSEQRNLLKKTCQVNNIDILELTTDEPFVPVLSEFLKERIAKKEVHV